VQTIQTHMLSMMSELLRGEYKMVFDMWDRCGPLPWRGGARGRESKPGAGCV
jgi:hypothetical protein